MESYLPNDIVNIIASYIDNLKDLRAFEIVFPNLNWATLIKCNYPKLSTIRPDIYKSGHYITREAYTTLLLFKINVLK